MEVSANPSTRERKKIHQWYYRADDLEHKTALLVKQRRQAIVTQSGDIRVNAAMTSKGHFRQRYQRAAIRAVVVREQLTLCYQRLNRVIETFQLRDVAYICRFIAKLKYPWYAGNGTYSGSALCNCTVLHQRG